MDVPFTNPDSRLRPARKLDGYAFVRQRINGSITLTPLSYRLTANAFPELYASLTQMRTRAGISTIEVAIEPHSDRISHSDGLIKMGLQALNRMSFEDMEAALAHELGHAWRASHPRANSPVARFPNIAPLHIAEVEADIFARCLTDNAKQTAAMLSWIGTPRDIYHPDSQIRAAIVRHSTHADCAAFNLLPANTPALATHAASKLR
jgi:hypothetical protein